MASFPFGLVVFVDITILTQSVCVEFFVCTLPRLFSPAILVITVVAHAFCIMFFVIMSAVKVHFFSILNKKFTFSFCLISFMITSIPLSFMVGALSFKSFWKEVEYLNACID